MYINFNGNNQVYINGAKKILCCSYTTIIAYWDRKKDIIVKTDKYYSVTSSKHFNQFIKFYGLEGKNIKIMKDDSFRKIVSKI